MRVLVLAATLALQVASQPHAYKVEVTGPMGLAISFPSGEVTRKVAASAYRVNVGDRLLSVSSPVADARTMVPVRGWTQARFLAYMKGVSGSRPRVLSFFNATADGGTDCSVERVPAGHVGGDSDGFATEECTQSHGIGRTDHAVTAAIAMRHPRDACTLGRLVKAQGFLGAIVVAADGSW